MPSTFDKIILRNPVNNQLINLSRANLLAYELLEDKRHQLILYEISKENTESEG